MKYIPLIVLFLLIHLLTPIPVFAQLCSTNFDCSQICPNGFGVCNVTSGNCNCGVAPSGVCGNDSDCVYICSTGFGSCNLVSGNCNCGVSPGGTSTFSQAWPRYVAAMGLSLNLTTLPGIINTLVPIIITLAGLILFIMLIAGGFQMLTSASNPEAAKAGQQRLTTALVGFLIIFAAYWIVQVVEIVLGINIFGNP